ncbi:hypothetical protein EXS57_00035 [Candidatus Kaiserbacteria bacterium]|nr:hypothetical protein [Candidatus Kaiserbacteria bacterium]
MEGASGVSERRKSAAAEGRAADFSFANETKLLQTQDEITSIDKQIEALKAQKQKRREFIAKTTSEKIIDIAEENEDAIDAQIAELELQKEELLGKKSN